jgi:hypothetical protein
VGDEGLVEECMCESPSLSNVKEAVSREIKGKNGSLRRLKKGKRHLSLVGVSVCVRIVMKCPFVAVGTRFDFVDIETVTLSIEPSEHDQDRGCILIDRV